ncbi:MAG: class I SAM-dependent methyltransferase [Sediminibacterium sp.]|nr:class I SAM-dependent methyltransferase [Sediminibacterium sp.]
MDFQLIQPRIEQFIFEHQNSLSNDYFQLDELNKLNTSSGHLQSSLLQIQYLIFYSKFINPTYALDIGTFNGASAMAISEGLKDSGFVHTIDSDKKNFLNAQVNFDKHPRKSQIIPHCGVALEIISTLHFKWDLVFIDADKANYVNYLNVVLPSLNSSGLIIADNIFLHGNIFDQNNQSQSVNGIRNFNEFTKTNPNLNICILPIRDGLMLISKK